MRIATSDAGRFTKQLFSVWSGTISAWAAGFFVDGAILALKDRSQKLQIYILSSQVSVVLTLDFLMKSYRDVAEAGDFPFFLAVLPERLVTRFRVHHFGRVFRTACTTST